MNTQEHANWRDIRDGIVMGWAMRRRNGTNDERNEKILTVNKSAIAENERENNRAEYYLCALCINAKTCW